MRQASDLFGGQQRGEIPLPILLGVVFGLVDIGLDAAVEIF
jgi:hypothetical protein